MKILKLSECSESAHHWSIDDALKSSAEIAKDDEFKKCFVILLDDVGQYRFKCINSGMSNADLVAALEAAKKQAVDELSPLVE